MIRAECDSVVMILLLVAFLNFSDLGDLDGTWSFGFYL